MFNVLSLKHILNYYTKNSLVTMLYTYSKFFNVFSYLNKCECHSVYYCFGFVRRLFETCERCDERLASKLLAISPSNQEHVTLSISVEIDQFLFNVFLFMNVLIFFASCILFCHSFVVSLWMLNF